MRLHLNQNEWQNFILKGFRGHLGNYNLPCPLGRLKLHEIHMLRRHGNVIYEHVIDDMMLF